jgi:NitT/TauT family transport system permease protein
MTKRALETLAPPVVAAIVGLALWEIAVSVFAVPAFLVPAPSAVVRAAIAEASLLSTAWVTTGATATLGFLLSAVVGVAIGTLLGASRIAERAFHPYAILLQTVPIVAIAPLLVLWFGVGARAVTASAFVVSLFPVVTNTVIGIRSVDPALRDLFRLYGASRGALLVKLELPHAAVSIATGLRIACGLAVIGAIVGEFVAGFADARPGLGIVVLTAYRQLRTDLLFAAVFGSALLGLGLFALVSAAAWFFLRKWHVSARS